MSEEAPTLNRDLGPISDFHKRAENLKPERRAERLRDAIRKAGGLKEVARSSGVPAGTISGYIAGGEMKVTTIVSLAEACGVTVGWLVAGEGPRSGEPEPAPTRPPEALNADRLRRAIEQAMGAFAEQDVTPDATTLARVVLIFYAALTRAEAG